MQDEQTIKASEFKAKCLQLMDRVNANGTEFVITKNGKPVSRLVPYRRRPESLFGLHRGRIASHDDLVAPVGERWEVENGPA